MSGILLPGQENKPASDIKIELPGGFSSRRKGEEPKPEEAPAESTAETPEQPAEPPAEAGTPARGGRGQPQIDLLFPPTGVQIRCPNCGNTYAVPLFSIIDLGVNPELKGPLLSGQVNVAVCPNCGAGGPLGAPLLIHEPDHQFLGVFAPASAQNLDVQQQKAIGDLTQTLMRKLPQEARKGYMLQPRQFADWNQLMEQLWEFEGVTPEMLRRQRNQGELLQRAVALANDRKALELAIQQRGADLVDRDFFALLDRYIVMANGQGQNAEPLLQLRNQLLEITPAGRQIKERQEKVRGILQGLGANTTRDQLLDTILNAWQGDEGREIASALVLAVTPLLDYQFLMTVSQRLEAATDETERQRLDELRQLIMTVQQQQTQAQQAVVQQVQQVLQEVLQAPDLGEALRQYADFIDETFLSVLAANIQAAQRNNATAAARRLQQVYDAAMALVQESLPEEMQLINQLLNAPDKAALTKLLQEHRPKLNKEFVSSLKVLETDMRDAGRGEVADRLKSLRAQISLMV
jgi:hypothetical protein